MAYTVGFTAHRKLTAEDIRTIHQVMKALVAKEHIEVFIFGGASGGDTEALKAALHFRGTSKRPKIVVAVPHNTQSQPFETRIWTPKADEVIELGHVITREDGFAAYGLRDQYLVDQSDSFVAFFCGDYRTGTGKTIRMAEAKGIPVTKVDIESIPKSK